MVTIREKWLRSALCVDVVDELQAQAAINKLYQCGGLLPPRRVMWFDSPFAAVLSILCLRGLTWKQETELAGMGLAGEHIVEQARSQAGHVFSQEARARFFAPVTDQVLADLSKNFLTDNTSVLIREQLLSRIGQEMLITIGEEVLDSVFAKVAQRVGVRQRRQTLAKVRDNILQKAQEEIVSQTSDALLAEVLAKLSAVINESVSGQVLQPLSTYLRNQFSNNIRPGAEEQLRYLVAWYPIGQFDVEMAYYDFFAQACALELPSIQGLLQVAKQVGWLWTFPDLAVASRRPLEIHRDNEGRLHHASQAAIRYADDWSVWAWHGTLVPSRTITNPATVLMIEAERNMELRRVMIERLGTANYLQQSGASEIHRDQFGVLYSKSMFNDEPLVMVKVTNSTPEPDGSFRQYFIRVPPDTTTARQGVAWSFGLSSEDYLPGKET